MKKKTIAILVSTIAVVTAGLCTLYGVSGHIRRNQENLSLTQTYYDAINKQYENWILSDEEQQTIEDALSLAQTELSSGKVSAETRLRLENLYHAIDQYNNDSQSALDDCEETFLEKELNAFLCAFEDEADLSIGNDKKIQTISANYPSISSEAVPSGRSEQIEFFFQGNTPENWTVYKKARENGKYRDAYDLIQTLLSDEYVVAVNCQNGGSSVGAVDKEEEGEIQFENEWAREVYVNYGVVPPVTYAEIFEMANQMAEERGMGDIDWNTYDYMDSGSTLVATWGSAMYTLKDVKGNETVTKEMYVAQLKEDINFLLDEEARFREEARRQSVASSQNSGGSSSQGNTNAQQPVQQEQVYVQETPIEEQVDYSSMDGATAGSKESTM